MRYSVSARLPAQTNIAVITTVAYLLQLSILLLINYFYNYVVNVKTIYVHKCSSLANTVVEITVN